MPEDKPGKTRKVNETELISTMRERFKAAADASDNDYSEMIGDLEFLSGGDCQWDPGIKADRDADGRPSLTINKLPVFVDRIIGDQRQNRPSIKVRPVDSRSDPETADVFSGIVRNIEVTSQAEIAYDTAFEGAVSCGFGVFRIVTEYTDDDVFDQDIKIKRILNQFSVTWDPDAKEPDKSDARYCFITGKLSTELFKELYPNASFAEWDAEHDRGDWQTKDHLRVCEYFVREPVKKTISLVRTADGDTLTMDTAPEDQLDPGTFEVLKQRKVDSTKIVWYKCNGNEILEGPIDWPGKYIPIVPVWGKEVSIEGVTTHRGAIRHSRDPQKLYNYYRSTGAETVALAPLAPFLMTPEQVAGYEAQWQVSHKRSFPYLLFNPDEKNPGAPQRQFPNQLHTGIQNEVLVANQEIHDTTGLQLASLGKESNETSGKAIMARQREGDLGSFAFIDNLSRALTYAGRILVDLIPKIYDTERIVRLLNEDGTDSHVPINQAFEDPKNPGKVLKHDITAGKYDVSVTTGPTYQSQREEAARSMMDFLQAFPQAAPFISDLIVKNMDWAGSDEIQDRLKKMLPPELREPEEGEPEGPPPPDPAQQLQQATAVELSRLEIEEKRAKVEHERKKAQGQELKNRKTQAEIEKIVAENAAKEREAVFNQ